MTNALADKFALHADEALAVANETCAHCGQSGAVRASVNDARVCHTDWKPGLPLVAQDDCYRLVTVYGEPLGSRT
jgi:hypothetical protein